MDPWGAPADGATVFLTRNDLNTPPEKSEFQATTDKGGRFACKVTPGRDYQICALWPGHGIGIGKTGDPGNQVLLNASESPTFRVVGEDGQPMVGISIQPSRVLLRQGGFRIPKDVFAQMAGATDERGFVTLTGIPARSFVEYKVSNPDYALKDQFRQRSLSTGEFETIMVVGPSCSLTGSISIQGQPIFGASLNIQAGPSRQVVTTDKEGRFRADGLPEGEVSVQAVSSGLDWVAPEATCTTKAGTTPEVSLKAEEGADVAGVVVDPSGKPIFREQLDMICDKNPPKSNTNLFLSEDGSFKTRLLAGSYRISLTHDRLEINQNLMVKDGQNQTIRVQTRSPILDLSVIVDGTPEGNPHSIPIDLISRQGLNEEFLARRFVNPNFPLDLRVPKDQLKSAWVVATSGNLMGQSKITDPGGPVTVHLLPIEFSGMEGVVTDESGKPISGAFVWTPHVRVGRTVADFRTLGSSKCMTEADGRFQFDGFYPGYKPSLKLQALGYEDLELAPIDLKPGERHVLPPIRMKRKT